MLRRNRTGNVCAAGLLPLLLLACGRTGHDETPPRSLELVEVAAAEFPGSAPLLGVASLDADRLVAWTASELLVRSGGEWRRVERHGPPIAVAVAGDGFEVAHQSGVVSYSWEGMARGTARDTSVWRHVDHAVRLDTSWVVMLRDTSGVLRIGSVVALRAGRDWLRVDPDTLPESRLPAYHLAAGKDHVYLSEAEPPFRTWRVGRAGRVGHASAPEVPVGGGTGPERWVALPMVDFPEGAIQTLADLASDWRVLTVYDRDGRLNRRTELRIPMGVVGTTVDGSHLVAVRNVGAFEIVWYRWRWVENQRLTGATS
jgi:hypothetical protein